MLTDEDEYVYDLSIPDDDLELLYKAIIKERNKRLSLRCLKRMYGK